MRLSISPMKIFRFFQTIQAKLIIIYVLLILIAMQLIGVYFIKTLENYFKTDFIQNRNAQAQRWRSMRRNILTRTRITRAARRTSRTPI
ncbi:cell wall metabolism sensor histidine kinase WalK [Paenibacillus sp. P25]|nr:cell wall metabolism sensor histidine kinase WalK [Paenibacillus sp. P25]